MEVRLQSRMIIVFARLKPHLRLMLNNYKQTNADSPDSLIGMRYRFKSPLGLVSYEWNGRLCSRIRLNAEAEQVNRAGDPVSQWLTAFFDHRILPLPPLAAPNTPFQARMRTALLAIPAGEVLTYGELAGLLNTAPRAMGQALGANPLPILIPCHRVVAAHGLGGFACGLAWKKKLLRFESDVNQM